METYQCVRKHRPWFDGEALLKPHCYCYGQPVASGADADGDVGGD